MAPVRRTPVHQRQYLLLGGTSDTNSPWNLEKGLQFLLSKMAFSLQCLSRSISSPMPPAETPLVSMFIHVQVGDPSLGISSSELC